MNTTDTNMNEAQLRRTAKRRVNLKMGFLIHLLVFVAVNGGLWLMTSINGGGHWRVFPLWGWGLGLAIHGLVTLINLQGQGLRERLLDSELKALRQRQL
ncbi:MAG: 2TM domain-containing protein [Burkholderiaceae bacterium]|nr:2TM domain-containing protein [Burkholderiaceae bacterium]